MISEHQNKPSIDLDITSHGTGNTNVLLEATEWTMMIAIWLNKGVFH